MDGPWTLAELTAQATAVLAAAAEPTRLSGRIRDLPNERLIRWYVTIGLVDPPMARRGRVALYGRRHLLQLVAVKRRQAAGRTLAEIQAELAGATDETLRNIAAPTSVDVPSAAANIPAPASGPSSPGNAPPAPANRPSASGNGPPGGRERFWTARPTPAATPHSPKMIYEDSAGVGDAAGSVSQGSVSHDGVGLMHGVKLAPGATLLLDVGALTPEDLAAIKAAARPLTEVLAAHGLIA